MLHLQHHSLKIVLLVALLSVPYMWTGVVAGLPALYNELWACLITGLLLSALFFLNKQPIFLAKLIRQTWSPLMLMGGLTCTIFIQSRLKFANSYIGVTGIAIGVLILAIACMLGGAVLSNATKDTQRDALSRQVAWIVLGIGLLQAAIGLLQYLELNLISTTLMSALTIAGRVYGNLRQPNHFALLLIVSLASCIWLLSDTHQTKKKTTRFLFICAIFLVMLIVLSVSRIGLLLLGLLSFWGAFACKSKPSVRMLLISFLPLYFLFRVSFIWIDEENILPFWGNARVFSLDAAGNQDRLSIFTSVLGTLFERPWLGVGYGKLSQAAFEQGHAWALTKNLESAHNLFVDWAVYFGIPLALAFSILLLICLAKCFHHAVTEKSWLSFFVLVTPLIAHMVEYPLEFPRFLLPWAGLLGYLMVKPSKDASEDLDGLDQANSSANITKVFGLSSLIFSVLVAWVAWDFKKVNAIYGKSETTFIERVVAAYESHFFVYLVDYAVLMASVPEPSTAQMQFRLATKVTQVRFDGPVLAVYIPVAVLSDNICFAKAAAYSGFKADQRTYQKLVATWLESPHQAVKSFAAAHAEPKPIGWPKTGQSRCDD